MRTFSSSAVRNMNDNQIELIVKLHFHIPPLTRYLPSCEKARQLIGPVNPLKCALSWYSCKNPQRIRLINKSKLVTDIIWWISHEKFHWENVSCKVRYYELRVGMLCQLSALGQLWVRMLLFVEIVGFSYIESVYCNNALLLNLNAWLHYTS